MTKYVHGYSPRETQRLQEQSVILEDLLHADTYYRRGEKVLEAGCGVGGQTVILARRSPHAEFTCVDICADSLKKASTHAAAAGILNAQFRQSDILQLPFADQSFDHVFVCFVLEHLDDPPGALAELKRVLVPGGSITVIEGDHGSCFWHPQTPDSRKVWECMIRTQQSLGHDPLIGRRLYTILKEANLDIQYVIPKWVYTDFGTPELTDGAINKIIVPMTQTAREQSLAMNLANTVTWEQGINDLERVAFDPAGTFFYTWFKGVGTK